MPRVAQAPRTSSTRSSRAPSASASQPQSQSPYRNTSVKIPLNDDVQEKARRLHSRQAMHDAQISQLKASGTPSRRKSGAIMRLEDLEKSESASPRTPRGRAARQSLGSVAAAASRRASMVMHVDDDDEHNGDDDDRVVVSGSVVTPMKRVPILANFEEWMKMATDNKINATNSWNFALIDYFHDMSLLKEGDGVNFQKASCTLDGCVKIYTSRVDSVATETGKLLSGLADSRDNKKKAAAGEGEGEDSEDELDEDGNPKKKQKKKQRSEATLAPSFAALQLKKLELEFAVDPLFKKASADFDEGGAKGLLLNHLMIDGEGRIVFDSSDDSNDVAKTKKKTKKTVINEDGEEVEVEEDDGDDDDVTPTPSRQASMAPGATADGEDDVPIDIGALGHRFFPELHRLDELDVCPSLKTFDLGNPSGSLDIPFLRALEDHTDKDTEAGGDGEKTALYIDEDGPLGFDDTDALGGFDLGPEVDFGEGGDAWAREARLEPQMRVYDAGAVDGDVADDLLLGPGPNSAGGVVGGPGLETDDFTIAMQSDKMHENILSYFDQALRKNWTSAEHWRIRKIKDVGKAAAAAAGKPRKEKEPFAIDFGAPMDEALAEVLYTHSSSNTTITLAKKDWKSKSRNLLPDDKHFHSKQLLSLFLKPRARLSRRRQWGTANGAHSRTAVAEADMDEAFWARQKGPAAEAGGRDDDDDGAGMGGNYDADFFADDGLPFAGAGDDDEDDLDGEEFADARDHFSPGADGGVGGVGSSGVPGSGVGGMDDGGLTTGFTTGGGFTTGMGFGGLTVTNQADLAFGTTLVTSSRRVRPEYVQYARVAKKVDVRRLKEELWKGIGRGVGVNEASEAGEAGDSGDRGSDSSRMLTPPPSDGPEAAQRAAGAGGSAAPGVSKSVTSGAGPTLKFTEVMNGLQRVYPKPAMKDISTSFCFICLLHLANEKGLEIEKTEGLTELNIRKDWTAEVGLE